jgi:hypothetical protein
MNVQYFWPMRLPLQTRKLEHVARRIKELEQDNE